MKRIWLGIGLLAGLLAMGLLVTEHMEDTHLAVSRELERASRLALAEDWTGAERAMGKARGLWEKKRHFTAAFADHEPMDGIDALFAELKIYAAARDGEAYGAGAANLARQLEALGSSHSLNWWNLL